MSIEETLSVFSRAVRKLNPNKGSLDDPALGDAGEGMTFITFGDLGVGLNLWVGLNLRARPLFLGAGIAHGVAGIACVS